VGKRFDPAGSHSANLQYATREETDARGWSIAAAFAAAACALHLLFVGRYGYFRDELYFAVCGSHLAWGYVDVAPLITWIAHCVRTLFGNSLVSLRFLPALSSGAKILLTAWIVRGFGGGRYAQLLAATLMFFCPIYLIMDGYLSMNSFEPLFWMGAVAMAMRIMSGGSPRLWLLFGALSGFGILNKYSMLLFGLALVLGLLVTTGFRYFRNPWIWLGALIALVIFLPNLLWQVSNHFPTIEQLSNSRITKNAYVPWYAFIAEQAVLMLPLAVPVVLAGLWFLLADEEGRRYRFLGWTFVFLLLEMLVLHGQIYYMAPVYPMLFASGAVWIEGKITASGRSWVKAAIVVPLAAAGIISLPLEIPILPVDTLAAYAAFWDVNKVHVENFPLGKLPQQFADQFGWEGQAATVASVYQALPAADRSRCAILTGNYGEAAAVDYFGARFGLPQALSGHNEYYLWGPRGYSGDVVIAVGLQLGVLRSLFNDVQQAATIENVNAMPAENNLPVYLCRMPRTPLVQAWPRLRNFY